MKYIGLVIAIIGIMILGYIVYYQAATGESAILYIPIGLAISFAGVFYHMRVNSKPKS